MNWSDLRTFLAVAQAGSLRQAALLLSVSQPTVARHIQDLESALGLPLFERRKEGHRLTPAGSKLLPGAQAMERAALRVEKTAQGLLDNLSETLRIEAGETAAAVLTRGLAARDDGPKIELLVSGISSQGAETPPGLTPDILVQHGMPEAGNAITRRVGSIACALYGAPSYAAENDLPLPDDKLFALPWLGYGEAQDHYVTMRWLRENMRQPQPTARLMNSDLLIVAARAEVGVAVLPCFLGDAEADLVRLSVPLDVLSADYWVLTSPELARSPSVKSAIAWITACFQRPEITGA